MSFFKNVDGAADDAILGLNIAFAADKRENKINLGAGVYKTAELKSFILNTVKKAEKLLIDKEVSKDYLPIDGSHEYVQSTKDLIFEKSEAHPSIYGAQTVGGTAALYIGGHFLKEMGFTTLYLSSPTWANHQRIFEYVGLSIKNYPYFNWKHKGLDFNELLQTLHHAPKNSILLLQACCHNPTGIDLSIAQWQEIFAIAKKNELFPFFDLAYQGFGNGIEEDRETIRLFLENEMEGAIAVSHAKNFGLYGERCGALFFVCKENDHAKRIGSRIRAIIRGIYSNPPCHGAHIVSTILNDAELKLHWQRELSAMRERIHELRRLLALTLQMKTSSLSFDFLMHQKGMFSYTGLNEKQVERLIVDYGIYMPKDGRLNVAGLNQDNLEYFTDAFLAVLG